jgi:glycosyltransferase involved in cell wall biosynthesis
MLIESAPVVLSLVVPAHNEAEALPHFFKRVLPILDHLGVPYEIVFVDDGSRDGTAEMVLAHRLSCPQVRLIKLSRNFGKEAALTAGLEHATGSAVIPIDADLQDPPELIPEMVRLWREGNEVVLGKRRDRSSDHPAKRLSAQAFYRVMARMTHVPIPENCGDFRLMDRRVVDALRAFPERARFMKGLMAACGFKTTQIEYDRPERTAGETKFNAWRLWNFALDGITSFTTLPLRVWTYIGMAVAFMAFAYAGWTIAKTLIWGVVTPGYATLLTVMLLVGGIQLVGIGILGEYIGRIFAETKRRPIYIVSESHGLIGKEIRS